MKTGLVLEGGGMRGIYTIGVLDALEEGQFRPDYIIGVSAGSSGGLSFASHQKGRGLRTYVNYIGDKRYLSLGNFFRERSLFGMNFIFGDIPERLEPYDYDTFLQDPCDYRVVVTNAVTGEAEYFGKEALDHDCTIVRASSSLPVFSPPVAFRGGMYMDGGVTDPIPVRRAFADGCDRVVAVLTRNRGYQKKPQVGKRIYRHVLRDYPKVADAIARRHTVYNETLAEIARREQEGSVQVIAPSQPITIGKFERKVPRLMAVYEMGKRDGAQFLAQM